MPRRWTKPKRLKRRRSASAAVAGEEEAIETDMEAVLKELAVQVPALLVLVWLVAANIKDRREGSKATAEAFAKRDAVIQDIAKDSAQTSRECAKVVGEAAEAIRQNTAALQRFNDRAHWSESNRASRP